MTRTEINIIINKLTDINIELIRKYGTDAYDIRCKIFDIKDELSKFLQPTVISAVCDNCEPVSGFYLGTTCLKCNRPFRSVKQTCL